MRKKARAVLLYSVLGAVLLGGCAATPEESLVKQKGAASLKNYEEADDAGAVTDKEESEEGTGTAAGENADGEGESAGTNPLRQMLGAPEHYQSETSDETGKLQILTDAEVEIPDAEKVSAIAVSQHPFDQAGIDAVTEVFFPDARFYTCSSYYQETKADYQKKIEELKGYVAEGNLDPYNFGTDENGNYVYDIYSEIEMYEQAYQEAPEERTLVEVHPQYGLLEEDGQGGTFSYDDQFIGVACREDGTVFDYFIKSGSMPMEIQIRRARGSGSEIIRWVEYSLMKGNPETSAPGEEEMPGEIGISLEDAQKTADEKAAELQLENMEMTAWEYGLCCETTLGQAEMKVLDAGYIFHYTRKLNGIPITYTSDWGGNLEDMESEMEPWSYEVLDIVVTEDGIDAVNYNNRYDIGEVRTENLNLQPFDKIMEIYEKMMVIQNADVLNYAGGETYHIDRIVFGYSRIYEPATDSRSGLLVPVWDFFGSLEMQYGEEKYISALEYDSHLTINAIDGSIIDRGLGY